MSLLIILMPAISAVSPRPECPVTIFAARTPTSVPTVWGTFPMFGGTGTSILGSLQMICACIPVPVFVYINIVTVSSQIPVPIFVSVSLPGRGKRGRGEGGLGSATDLVPAAFV